MTQAKTSKGRRRGGRKRRPPTELPLTAKELLFCDEYPIDLNATAAARRAGYSVKSAACIGYQLLHKTTVVNRIAEVQLARMAALELSGDKVLKELARIGFSDPRTAFSEDGSLKPILELPPEVAAAIASIEVEEEFEGSGEERVQSGFTKKIRFWNKVEALSLLGKHLRLFVERLEVNDPQGIVKRMWEGRKRAGLERR